MTKSVIKDVLPVAVIGAPNHTFARKTVFPRKTVE